MQILRYLSFCLFSFFLILIAAGSAHALGTATYESCQIRFQGMDQNGDCVITRAEWRGSEQSFREQDWNRDGVLSGAEVEVGGRQGSDYGNRSFSNLDRNRDNVISRNEWGGSSQTFNELDCNRDSMLTESEFHSRTPCNIATNTGSFQYLDANRDGYISRAEWNGNYQTFVNMDCNRDSMLTESEFHSRTPCNVASNSGNYQYLDTNRDGYVSRAEWNGNYQTFVNMDCNRDSLLSPTELNSRGRCSNSVNSGTFQFLDTNNDGYIEDVEWSGNVRSFNNKDCNRDGRISRGEFFTSRCNATTCDYTCLFRELDNNGDGWVDRSEWRGNTRTFDQLDFNGDQVLSRRELSSISNSRWQSKSGTVLNTVDSILNSVLYNR